MIQHKGERYEGEAQGQSPRSYGESHIYTDGHGQQDGRPPEASIWDALTRGIFHAGGPEAVSRGTQITSSRAERPISFTRAGSAHVRAYLGTPACLTVDVASSDMPIARITVTSVSDEGDNVIVWGLPEHAADESEPIGFVFQTKGAQADVGLAERASRLVGGTEAVISYASVADGWNVARELSAA